MKIFFSAGEPSGDLHGANLIRQIKARDPNFQAVGFGGPKMAAAGMEVHEELTKLAVMGLLLALLNLHKFLLLAVRADRYFRHHTPDAVVLIDFPGFNWWIARRAKAHGIEVFYHVPPQIWAWAQWRVKKMRRLVDHVLCSLPFEATWFQDRGCNATFIGHPYFDEVAEQKFDEEFIRQQTDSPGPLITILPGSRGQEVSRNLKWFLKTARIIQQQVPDVRFAVACFKSTQAEFARELIAEQLAALSQGQLTLRIEVHTGKTPELIKAAHCCMAVSGSVSLELLHHTKPTVILYSIARWAFIAQRFFRKIKYITLVNLLAADELYPQDMALYDPNQPDAERVLFPEYLTCQDKTQQIADHLVEWLSCAEVRSELVAKLSKLKTEVAHGGASHKAADYILEKVRITQSKAHKKRKPHFMSPEKATDTSDKHRVA